MDFVSAEQYARHLATYIASPTKIEAMVRLDWSKVPPLHRIAQWRYEFEQAAKRKVAERSCKGGDNDNGEHWKPRALVLPKVAKPRPVRRPPPPRERDYIWVDTPRPDNPPGNPFIGRFATGRRLVESVAYDFGLLPSEVVGRGRSTALVHARAVVATLLRERGWSYPTIGNVIGGRDHSTVIHVVEHIGQYAVLNDAIEPSLARHRKLRDEALALEADIEAAA